MAERPAFDSPEQLCARLAYGRQVAMVAAERAEAGTASTYDRFMRELPGDRSQRGEYKENSVSSVLPYRPVQMVTENCIAFLCGSVPYPTRPEEMLVVYADLQIQRCGALPVRDIIRSGDHTRAQQILIGDAEESACLVLGTQIAGFCKPDGVFELYAGTFEAFRHDLIIYENTFKPATIAA
jgi:hypothetical protein